MKNFKFMTLVVLTLGLAAPAAMAADPAPATTAAEVAAAKAAKEATRLERQKRIEAALKEAEKAEEEAILRLEAAATISEEMASLIPTYRNEAWLTHGSQAFMGLRLAQEQARAAEAPEALAAGKAEKASAQADIFVKLVLDQDELRISEYSAARDVAAKAGDVQMAEAIIREQIADERELELFENPGLLTRLKWWWNS
jgi:hypothetical protein